MTRPMVLIVDGAPDNRRAMEIMMERGVPDCSIAAASTANEALEQAARLAPALIIVDAHLPPRGGIDLCRRLKAGQATARTPVMLVTSHFASAQDKAAVLGAGADSLLTRPVHPAELAACVNSMLRIKHAEDELRLADEQLKQLLYRQAASLDQTQQAVARTWREAEQQLEEQRALSIRSARLQALGEMASGMAHELNQPLTGIRGLAEHMLIAVERKWEMPEGRLQKNLRTIVEQVDRMSATINHLRMFARSADKTEVRQVRVNDVIRAAMGMLGSQLRSRGVQWALDLDEDMPPVVANPFALEEAILNILFNARDAVEDAIASGAQPAPPAVTVRTRAANGEGSPTVRVEVEDKGGGIPYDVMPRVMEPFFTTKEPGRGSGLGLAVCKATVESIGGTLDVQSELGAGTMVSMTLPAAPPGRGH